MKKEKTVLDEDIDAEVLAKMPEWFKRLRARYRELGLDKRK